MITGNDLIKRGWKAGPAFGQALKRAHQVIASGGSVEAALAAAGDPPEPPKTLALRANPIPLNEAVGTPVTNEEKENLISVREHMSRLLQVPVITGAAVMPDCCPAGSDPIVVGGAIAVKNAIIPAAHSSDVCCSMYASFFPPSRSQEEQMEILLKTTRFGQGGRPEEQWVDHPVIQRRDDRNPFLKGLDRYTRMHLADQGDGNHFAYLGKISLTAELKANLERVRHRGFARALFEGAEGASFLHVLVTHHGSRGLGAQVYKRGKNTAEEFARKLCPETPKGTEWIPYETPEGQAYWEALRYIRDWTEVNHELIHDRFLGQLHGVQAGLQYFNAHNFVWQRGDTFFHGKGATPAWKDAAGLPFLGLIPLNMASPILLVAGNDNEQFLSFAPHGAGRNRSRTQTIRNFSSREEMERAYQEATKGLDVRWYSGKMDVAESPIGYKDATKIKNEIQEFGLATVLGEITPYGCIMAGEQPEPFWKAKKKIKKKLLGYEGKIRRVGRKHRGMKTHIA
jgi:hypothetical protein